MLRLLLVNGAILGVTAVAGYFLAGKTLEPLERAVEEQKRFVADASHELRTPLTALKTSIEVALREKEISLKEAKRVLAGNLQDTDRLQSLTSKLLSLSRLQSGGNGLEFGELNLGEIVGSAAKKIRPLAEERGVDLQIGVGDHSLEADKGRLEEMLTIFLDNAVKYTPGGGYVAVTSEANNKEVTIKVKDSGVGIDKEDIPHIFDRFYRADKSRWKTGADGFGLGLALAKEIIELHQGSVEVSSTLNEGTAFTIKLPLRHS